MNPNEKYIRQKFEEGAKHLEAGARELVSLKYRQVGDRRYYDELLRELRSIKSLSVKDIGHTMAGQGYILSYGKQRIALVEHETGLEILYIGGSIASIIGLVLYVGSMIRDHRRGFDRFPSDFENVEIRYFDQSNKYIEEHHHHYLPQEVFLLPESKDSEIEKLKAKIARLEKKIALLKKKQPKRKKK